MKCIKFFFNIFFSPFSLLVIFLLLIYKRAISPVIPNHCKYFPTCSSYSIGALKKYLFPVAIAKITYRILRCNPFSNGGVDYP